MQSDTRRAGEGGEVGKTKMTGHYSGLGVIQDRQILRMPNLLRLRMRIPSESRSMQSRSVFAAPSPSAAPPPRQIGEALVEASRAAAMVLDVGAWQMFPESTTVLSPQLGFAYGL